MLLDLAKRFRVEIKPSRGTITWQAFQTWGDPVLAHEFAAGTLDQSWPLTGVVGEVAGQSAQELGRWLEQFVGPDRAPHSIDLGLRGLRPPPPETDALGQIERHTALTLAQEEAETGQAWVVLDDQLIDVWRHRLRRVDQDRWELPQVPVLVRSVRPGDHPAAALVVQLYWTGDGGLTFCEDLSSFLWRGHV